MSRDFDINPAGGYLRALKARKGGSGTRGLPLNTVLEAAGPEPLPLDELRGRTGLEVDALLNSIDRLSTEGLVEKVDAGGRHGVRLTSAGMRLKES